MSISETLADTLDRVFDEDREAFLAWADGRDDVEVEIR